MSGGGIGYKMLGRRVPCSLSFPPALIARLDALAVRNQTSRSWLVERILSGWLSEHEADLDLDHVAPLDPPRSRPARRRDAAA